MTDETKAGLGVALNEATLLGAEVARDRRLAAITFAVLSLPEAGPPAKDAPVSTILAVSTNFATRQAQVGVWENDAIEEVRTR